MFAVPRTLSAVLLLLITACASRPADEARIARRLDAVVADEVRRAGLPGATYAVWYGGQLRFQGAVGLRDAETGAPMTPDLRLRIASVSKPLTAITVLRLAEAGRLDLDAPVLTPIAGALPGGVVPHPGFASLTARQLLNHCGGLAPGFDPMFQTRRMMRTLRRDAPPSAGEIVAWALERPPDHPPGTRCEYSNLGYAVLGRLIEAVTDLAYEDAVRHWLLEPADVADMRIAASLAEDRGDDEPRYHDPRSHVSAFDRGRVVPLPYGVFAIEAMDAHGGWLASSVELVGLLAAVDGRSGAPLLGEHWREAMLAGSVVRLADGSRYGLGWELPERGLGYWHGGDLPGSFALLVSEPNGSIWALLANGGVEDPRTHERMRRRLGRVLARL
jgi:CubicO group peptidase (beta-lactamase class C family)